MGINREADNSITLALNHLESEALASAIIQQVRSGHPTLLTLGYLLRAAGRRAAQNSRHPPGPAIDQT